MLAKAPLALCFTDSVGSEVEARPGEKQQCKCPVEPQAEKQVYRHMEIHCLRISKSKRNRELATIKPHKRCENIICLQIKGLFQSHELEEIRNL